MKDLTLFDKILLAIVVVLTSMYFLVQPVSAAYFDKREIAEGVTCYYYQTSKDEADLYDILIRSAYYGNFDVILDKEDYDGYDRVLIVKASEGFYSSRWDKGLYCIQLTPLPQEKPL